MFEYPIVTCVNLIRDAIARIVPGFAHLRRRESIQIHTELFPSRRVYESEGSVGRQCPANLCRAACDD